MLRKNELLFASAIILIIVAGIFWVRPYSRLLLTIFPPSNLYVPLVKQRVYLNQVNDCRIERLAHSYAGTYFVEVHIDKPPPYGAAIVTNLEGKFSIRENESSLIEKYFTQWSNRFGGPGSEESGIILGFYKVPDDVPIGLVTTVEFSIVTPDPSFEKKFGQASLVIRRVVDQ